MDSDATMTCFFPWLVPVYHVASLRRSRTSETVHRRHRLLLQERGTTCVRPATVPRTATRFDLKLAPNKALLGAAEIILLRHKISSEGVGPDPHKVKAMKEMPMPQNFSQLRSLLWSPVVLQTSTHQDGRSNTTAQLPATKKSQIRVHTPQRAHRPRNVSRIV